MIDYTKILPDHMERYIGENDLFLEIYQGIERAGTKNKRPPLLLVHGAYTGSWMWSKYIPHFVNGGWDCYVMNMRGHYKSRVMDLTKVYFEDYLEDIKEVIGEVIRECGEPPIILGFSMGGILCQKTAESISLTGLVLIDSSISREVHDMAPYENTENVKPGIIVPAPERNEEYSMDESAEDITFQKKYLAAESTHAFLASSFLFGAKDGISIDSSLIKTPCLVIKAINSEEDDRRGQTEALHLRGEYLGLYKTTHTGLLVGQRYIEAVERIIKWLKRF
ncbi:alpha/beta hydrolase [Anaerocolumna sp. MB42-C2]|uniref:alpha/beta hydrolase n=1 Tax=Anaerocolumna sp. MB42-C2 TaxID=3070997 RepID=UPI0027E076EA|nr:alpha/beta hydrolase [Anaerocolumna sp. MB42-C2]WMJ89316.1 alpha/beta hydrolase [Anaerocolumna sp. MB42-C2]